MTEQRKTVEQRLGQKKRSFTAANVFTAPHFQTAELAREWLEKIRWPEGPVCSHCGVTNYAYKTKKPGWYRCAEKECRKDFTVTTGTVMERSHIALNKWLMGFYMMSSNGVSAHQLHRTLNLSYKSAWFMCHRIREAMRCDSESWSGPLSGSAKVAGLTDEHGRLKKPRVVPCTINGKAGPANKRTIVALVERDGNVRTFDVSTANKILVNGVVKEDIARMSRLLTDSVKPSADEYVCGGVHTNSADYFSIFKRDMRGVYHHCMEKHLHRYLAEFVFRYNHRIDLGYSNIGRTRAAIKGVEGKRLMYRKPR